MTSANRKVAIVTGAAKGIGEAIALRLAKDGLDVALVDLASSQAAMDKVAAAAQALGAKTTVISCNVANKAEVEAMVQKTVADLGRVDVMVANAGIAPVGPFLELEEDTMDRLLGINVKGVIFCYQAAATQMIKQGEGGRLIAACSTAGMRGYSGFSMYSATKFAVRSLNQSAALELAEHKITCNVYCPGPVNTDMWTTIDRELTSMAGIPEGGFSQQMVLQNPMGRLVHPQDVAGLVSFLAGPDSGFITGESMLVSVSLIPNGADIKGGEVLQ